MPSRHDRTAHTGGTHALTRAPPALPACWRRSPWQRNARRADKGTMLAAFSAGPRGRALPRGCSGRPVARVLRTGTRQMRVVSSRACVGGGASPSAPNLVRPHRSQVVWRAIRMGERSYRNARCRSAGTARDQMPCRLGHAQTTALNKKMPMLLHRANNDDHPLTVHFVKSPCGIRTDTPG